MPVAKRATRSPTPPEAAHGPLALTLDLTPTPGLGVRQWQHNHPGYNAPPAGAHAQVEISWIDEGCVRYGLDRGRCLDVTGGEGIVVPAGVTHRSGFRGPTIGRSLKVPASDLEQAGELLGREPRPLTVRRLPNSGPLITLARLLHAEATRGARSQRAMLGALTRALSLELLRQPTSEREAELRQPLVLDPRIAVAREAIEHRFAEPLSIDQLARAAGMSRYHFGRRFRDLTGKSPYAYLLETRVAHAANLLASGTHNVTEAAYAVGFNDLGRFSQRFRRIRGLSPSVFRRRALDAH